MMSSKKKVIVYTSKAISTFLFFVLIFSAVFFLLSNLGIKGFPKLYIVQSGSMSPTIPVGSVILSSPQVYGQYLSPIPTPKYDVGDVITFKSGASTTTHRITEISKSNGEFIYKTKGDANNGIDTSAVYERDVVGKMVFKIPSVGYFVSFAKTQKGYTLLIVIPITIIIYNEILAIKGEVKKYLSRKSTLNEA